MYKIKISSPFLFILIFFSSNSTLLYTEATENEIKLNDFMNNYDNQKSKVNIRDKIKADEYFKSLDEDDDRNSWVDPYDMFNYDSFSLKEFVEKENNEKYSFNNDKKWQKASEISKQNDETNLKVNVNSISSNKPNSRMISPAKYSSNTGERVNNKMSDLGKEQNINIKDVSNNIDVTSSSDKDVDTSGTSESSKILYNEMNKYLNYDIDKKSCNGKDYIFLTRWMNKLLKKLENSPYIETDEIKTLQFIVTNKVLQGIKNFVDFPSQNIHDLETIVSDAISGANVFVDGADSWWTNTFSYVSSNQTQILWMFCILMTMFIWIIRPPFPLFNLKTIVLFIVFISVFWHWVHLYKKQLAKKLALLDSQSYPPECRKAELGIWQSVNLWIKSYFVYEDNCVKYYEATTVDPFWEVSPLMAISETLANFLLQPLGAIGFHFKSFIKELFSDLPFFYWIPVIIFLTIFLIMLCNYRLKLPFFLGALEPAPQSQMLVNTVKVQPLINRIEVLPETENKMDNKRIDEMHSENKKLLQKPKNKISHTDTNMPIKKCIKHSLSSETGILKGNTAIDTHELESNVNANPSLEEIPNLCLAMKYEQFSDGENKPLETVDISLENTNDVLQNSTIEGLNKK